MIELNKCKHLIATEYGGLCTATQRACNCFIRYDLCEKQMDEELECAEATTSPSSLKGYWLLSILNNEEIVRCSNCGITLPLQTLDAYGLHYYRNYCPNCGEPKVGGKTNESDIS